MNEANLNLECCGFKKIVGEEGNNVGIPAPKN